MDIAETLESQLRTARRRLSQEMRGKWDRVLPLDEMALDRWEKARELGFGEGSSCYENVYVYGRPTIGRNVWIGPFAILDATGGLTIGDSCDISCNVMIFTHSTHLCALTGDKSLKITKPVTIRDHVYVGSGAVILPGVTIGHHSVIGAGSVVTRSIPSHSIAFGVPARVVGKVLMRHGVPILQYGKSHK